RHTSFSRDWSSDVCSSDLLAIPSAALDAYREVAGGSPSHPGMRESLLTMMNGDDAIYRREAAQILVPVYEAEQNSEKLIEAYRRSEERRVGKECRYRWCPC